MVVSVVLAWGTPVTCTYASAPVGRYNAKDAQITYRQIKKSETRIREDIMLGEFSSETPVPSVDRHATHYLLETNDQLHSVGNIMGPQNTVLEKLTPWSSQALPREPPLSPTLLVKLQHRCVE